MHVQDNAFRDDQEAVIARMKEENVSGIVVGTDIDMSEKAVSLAEAHDHLYASIGNHPTDNQKETFDDARMKELARSERVVAVGECGLDYFHVEPLTDTEAKRQRALFETQLEFAVAHALPLMIHCRPSKEHDAHADMLDMLTDRKREYGEKLSGNIHFFTGSADVAKRYIDLNFTVSFPGVITFAKETRDAVRETPLTHMHAETDSPYAAPVPHRGTRNEPVYVKEVVAKIAELKERSEEEVVGVLRKNAQRIFGT